MFDNKFDQYRTKVCPEIGKITFVNLFTYFIPFLNIFSNILTPLCPVYILILRNVGPRINRGCF